MPVLRNWGLGTGTLFWMQQGIQQSRQQMKPILLESMELGLELKFGEIGLSLLPEISPLEDVDQLRAIHIGLRTANTVEDLPLIYQQERS